MYRFLLLPKCQHVFKKSLFLLLHLTARLSMLLCVANRNASWNKARIHYKRLHLLLDYLDLTHTDKMAYPET